MAHPGVANLEEQLKNKRNNLKIAVESFVPTGKIKESSPCKVIGLHGEIIKSIAVGEYHSVVLKKNGHVFTWGMGSKNRLGHPYDKKNPNITVPTLVEKTNKLYFSFLSCGSYTTYLIESPKPQFPKKDQSVANDMSHIFTSGLKADILICTDLQSKVLGVHLPVLYTRCPPFYEEVIRVLEKKNPKKKKSIKKKKCHEEKTSDQKMTPPHQSITLPNQKITPYKKKKTL